MIVDEAHPNVVIDHTTPKARPRFPMPSLILGSVGVAFLAASAAMAWQHYTTPSAAVSLVTMQESEREVQAVAGEMQNLKFEISNAGQEPIRIVGLADF